MALPLQNENRGVIETEEEASFRRVVAHGIALAMADVQDSIDECKRCEGGLPLGRAYDDMGEKIAALRGALARLAALKGGA